MQIWQLPIIDGAVPIIVYTIAGAFLLVVLVRRWDRRTILWAAGGAIAGAGLGVALVHVVDRMQLFGPAPLPGFVLQWAAGALAASGVALGALVGARWWRRIVSALAVLVFLVAAAIGINAGFGLNPTLATLFGVSGYDPLDLPDVGPTTDVPTVPLAQSFVPPAGMPAKGSRGTQVIPATASGFAARPVGIYLPPAALVPNAPALPLVIMMMGHPGNPDPTAISDVLDEFAARNHGLAPIVIVADQVGSANADTACADSAAFGRARTYVTQDVVAWAKAHLRIINDPAFWTIAGYSNGGGCAISFGADYPAMWKNILDISGEPFPGSEQVANITKTVYGGSSEAFEASKPVNILAAAPAGTYAGMTAVFTAGSADPAYMAHADTLAAAARKAGMAVTRYDIPGVGHTGDALKLGLVEGFTVLYPVLGLSVGQTR
ncbi:alpha/beta hydrolase [Microbacterium sp. MRS-1]|uniref:alpha/beta hydrolase n=1 Tax=Microbacterium sp. MRS-1 TaxID=1451261 RepID=UPI00044F0DD5|nr:PHB depolymerase family esterase [Microbacterium sp. MRS-1]EXJ52248.1 esterase [Microbacterium sp. MRS-1]